MTDSHSVSDMSDEAFGWYFTGLTDGEGNFTFVPQLRRINFCARFRIGLRDDEAPFLSAIHKRIGVGSFRPDPGSPGVRKHGRVVLEVTRLGDLAGVIVPHFDRFPLRLKKARDFVVWREAVLLLYATSLRPRGRGLGRGGGTAPRTTAEERLRFSELATRLRAVRAYTGAPSITKTEVGWQFVDSL